MLSDTPLSIELPALADLASLLLERAGLKFTPDGYYGLKLALRTRMPALGISDGEDYVRRLRQAAGEHELRSLLPLVTVAKTDFFRDPRQFAAISLRIFPELLKAVRREGRKGLVWSAGCATGEEPYSLAMAALELGARPSELDIWATDLNAAAVDSARVGRFPARRLAGVTPERVERFFKSCEEGFEVQPPLREFIRFEGLNLATPVFPKVLPASMDLILCRNVIIYFDLPTIRALMDRFWAALRPGGVLLLGYSESLFKVYDRFEMIELEGSFVYRRPLPELPAARAAPPKPAPPPKKGTAAPPKRPLAAKRPSSPAPAQGPVAKRGPAARLDSAVELMDRGDFGAALDAVSRLLADERTDLDALLTLGNLHSLMGHPGRAREAFAAALACEPLCVEARIFAGVAALQAGALPEARAELTKALFLEPTLSLGHYLLAQVQERLGEREAARRSYRNVIAQTRLAQRHLAGHYPEMPDSAETIARAARYGLAALEES